MSAEVKRILIALNDNWAQRVMDNLVGSDLEPVRVSDARVALQRIREEPFFGAFVSSMSGWGLDILQVAQEREIQGVMITGDAEYADIALGKGYKAIHVGPSGSEELFRDTLRTMLHVDRLPTEGGE